ncbi:MAG: GTPase HflX [Thermoproteus sp. JCHS_4]|jgi:GTP-binding proten HflX|nr:MAG: GTPase HflX [Thermoproteus sp. JCHS_4]
MRNRALLAYVGPRDRRLGRRLAEFEALAEVAGYEVAGVVAQYGERDTRFYLGRGKLDEVAGMDFDVFVAYHELTPLQSYNLRRRLGVDVMDRVLLILKIFERRAGGIESKLQIELASLKYQLPLVKEYLRRAKMGEQIGYMGAGEYAVDAYYRHMVSRISHIKRRLDRMREDRVGLMKRRRDLGVPEVVLTGYTSVGKTTLFNRLTAEHKYVDGKPFATLDTYSRRINLWGKELVLTDTIGFIEDLPPVLIESFYSTLQEVADADLVLLLVDVSDDEGELARELQTSLDVLSTIGVYREKILPVLSKVDRVSLSELVEKASIVRRHFPLFVPVSALTGFGINTLKLLLFWKTPGYAIYEARPPIGGLMLDGKSYLPVKMGEVKRFESSSLNLYIELRRVL